MKIAVGSTNPVKIQAVKSAFTTIWPHENWEVTGVKVPSGVSEQPMSHKESIKGARNRAKRAQKALLADYGVGLEGGLEKIGNQWFDCGWIVVRNLQGEEGFGSSIRSSTPPKMMELVFQGKELGEINDIIFKKKNSKQKEGHFGLMTNNAITRKDAYTHGVIIALARFLHPHLY